MAIYTYQCGGCGSLMEKVQSISSYCVAPEVPSCCGAPATRYLTAPMVNFDTPNWGGYKSPIDGEFIDSRTKRDQHMAKHGVVPTEEVLPDFDRARKQAESDRVKDLKRDVIEAVHKTEAGYKPVLEQAEA